MKAPYWSFVPGASSSLLSTTCAGTTGVSFTGKLRVKLQMETADECCNIATNEEGVQGYTFTSAGSTGECQLFASVSGRNATSGAVSGVPPLPGNCTVWAAVTGNTTHAGAVSGSPSNKAVQLWPSWPASSPWVTAVGATRFVGQVPGSEEMASDQFGSGGGFSTMFNITQDASWQASAVAAYLKAAPQLPPAGSFPTGGRGTPDVSALGEGYQVLINGELQAVGGTSASAPAFAGLVSLLNEARTQQNQAAMGFLNPWIYSNQEAFTDVTKGSNMIGRGEFSLPYGYNCTKGWDPVTGVGTPDFRKMLAAALKKPNIFNDTHQ